MSLKEGLQLLLKVQDVDLELKTLEEAKSKYPEEISRRQAEITRAEGGLKELTDRLAELERRRRQNERELETAREQLKKLEARFSEVKTNKEYDALQIEVEACKGKMSEHEGAILEIIESSDGIGEQVELETQDVEELRQEQQARIDELQAKLDSLQGEVDGGRRAPAPREPRAHGSAELAAVVVGDTRDAPAIAHGRGARGTRQLLGG